MKFTRQSISQTFNSIQGKLTLLMLGVALIPLLALGALAALQSQKALSQRILDDKLRTAQFLAAEFTQTLEERLDDMVVLAGTARVRTLEAEKAGEAAEQYFDQWQVYENIFVAGADGLTIFATNGRSLDLRSRDYFQRAMNGERVIAQPEISPVTGAAIVTIAAPVEVDGARIGVVGGELPVDYLTAGLKTAWVGESGEAYLINQAGLLISPSRFEDELKQAGLIRSRSTLELTVDTQGSREALAGRSGVGEYENYRGVPVLGVYQPIAGSDWALLVEEQSSEALAAAASLQTLFIAVTGLAAVVIAVLGIVTARQLSRPIRWMARSAQALSLGDTSQRITYTSRDEIGELADSFRQMIAYQEEAASAAASLAAGDLTVAYQPRSAQDTLGNALQRMIARLQQVVGEIAQNAGQVQSASAQLADASRQADSAAEQIAVTVSQVATGITHQSESATATAGAVEQISGQIERVAAGAQQQDGAVGKATDIAREVIAAIQFVEHSAQASSKDAASAALTTRNGTKTVEETIRGMEIVRAKVGFSAQKVSEMGQFSDQIGVILETIEDIASQTNLLALNAAIEAARGSASASQMADALLNQQMTGQARLVAAHLAQVHASCPPDYWADLARTAGIDAVTITDADGVVVQANDPNLLGFRFSDDPKTQTFAFRQLIQQRDGVLCQQATRRTVDQQVYKYVGVSRVDQPGIVQVGYRAETLARFQLTGSGFAVVADEVRKLADRASGATKEIAALIKRIRATIREATLAMSETTGEVNAGVGRAHQATQALESILNSIEALNSQVEGIAAATQEVAPVSAELLASMNIVQEIVQKNSAASEQMAASSADVTRSVENIASVSEQNSAAIEEVAAATQEISAQAGAVSQAAQSLASLAAALQAAVAQFRLAESDTGPATLHFSAEAEPTPIGALPG